MGWTEQENGTYYKAYFLILIIKKFWIWVAVLDGIANMLPKMELSLYSGSIYLKI